MARPDPFAFGGFREAWFGGGVKGGMEEFVGRIALMSLGLGFEFTSEMPASEGLDSRMTGGCVAEVGVGNGGACDCVDAFLATVGLRFLLGWPLEYCGCCDGKDGCW